MRCTANGLAFILFSSIGACSQTDSRANEAGGGRGMGGAGGMGGVGGAGAAPATQAGKGSIAGGSGTASGGASSSTSGSAGALNDEAGAAAASGSAGEGAGGSVGAPLGLSWPVDCIPDQTCVNLGYPDTDNDGKAHDCGDPAYPGHEGTDIGISFEAEAAGTAVRAAADGVVLFAFDGKFDQCPNDTEPDCQAPPSYEAEATTGNTVCTPVGPYCGTGEPGCFWCFAGGNVLVIRHEGVPGVFATRYDHLKRKSLRVGPGDHVARGQKIAEAASAGNSSGPHLHFEVWGTGFYELADPWAGPCGPNTGPSLWAYAPPWSGATREFVGR
jgi:murein DD-endopeptidase MepM/ murein hydrolase activator NlpD